MIYLDNAATTFPKPKCVISELKKCLTKYCGNPGRGGHKLSIRAAEEIFSVRELVAEHFGAEGAENIVFTPNATFALNLAIKTLIQHDCHVLCSAYEHNSVIRPLNRLVRERNVEYSLFFNANEIESKIKENTKAIVCSIASNVTGAEQSLEYLSRISEKRNIRLIIDASQAVGHRSFNLKSTPCDAFCAPGHKGLFGIQGSGFVYLKNNRRNESFLEGGSGFESKSPQMPLFLPEAYEAGTLSTPAIVSLGAGIKYINGIGTHEIAAKLNFLTERFVELASSIKNIKIYGYGSGIVTFNIDDIPSMQLADYLNQSNICVRGGLHCNPSAHKTMNTLDQGAVRASFSYLNSEKDVDGLTRSIKNIKK